MTAVAATRWQAEARKLPAFFRRDFLVMRSYGFALVADWLNLIVQVMIFSFVSRMVVTTTVPEFGGRRPSYLAFVTIGIAIGGFVEVGLSRLVGVLRNEQLMGTLESLLLTSASLTTLQLGSVIYDLAYVPIRTVLFLLLVAALFGVQLHLAALGPALAVLVVFVPLVWGLGVMMAAAVLTFRRGAVITGFGGTLLAIGSGAYFPIGLLPRWLETLMTFNPVAIALRASREALLGNGGWGAVLPDIAILAPMALVALALGAGSFRLALARELRRGTVGLY